MTARTRIKIDSQWGTDTS